MTRQHCIQLLTEQNYFQLTYNFYVDECIRREVDYISPEVFTMCFPEWNMGNYYMTLVYEYYIKLYDIRVLSFQKTIIKYI